MNTSTAKILMASVILARSTSFLFSKICLEDMGPFELLAIRFFLAFLILSFLYRKRMAASFGKNIILRGMVLGAVLYLVMGAEMMALKESDIYLTAFLENTAFLFVPLFLWAFQGEGISRKTAAAMAVMTAGVCLLTLKGSGNFHGAAFGLAAAFFYGLFIYLTGRLASGEDGLSLGIWQMGFMGLLNGISALAAGEITMPSSPEIIGALLALTLLCSAFGFTFQTVAQQFISTEEAGLFSALDPLFATMWGMIFQGENPGLSGAAGALLVLLGMAGAQDGLLFKIRMKFRFLMKSTLP